MLETRSRSTVAYAGFLLVLFAVIGALVFSNFGRAGQPTPGAAGNSAPSTPSSATPSHATPSVLPTVAGTVPSTVPSISTPSIAPTAKSTVALSPTSGPTSGVTPSGNSTATPLGFDARRLKIGLLTRLTSDDTPQLGPTTDQIINYPVLHPWAPDSQSVLYRKIHTTYTNGQQKSSTDIYLARPQGPVRVLASDASEASWSVDGSHIVYGLLRNNLDLATGGDGYIIDVSGLNARRIVSGVPLNVRPKFLPDGTIAVSRASRIVIVNPADGQTREMPNISISSDGVGGFLFSPDGSHLAFKASSRDPVLKLTTASGTGIISMPGWVDNLEANVAWSPDSKYLAYVTSSPSELYIVDATGQNRRRLFAPEANPQLGMGGLSWTPDSRVIIFGVRRGSQAYDVEMKAVNIDGSGVAQLLEHAWPHALSPNGGKLLLTQSPGNLWSAEVLP